MAWPNTPLTTYVANSTPAIKAADLNSIQSAINGIVTATTSLEAVVVDGTGGNTVTPTAGTLKLSATIAGQTAPTPTPVNFTYYKDLVPFAYGYITVSASATLVTGFNISSLTYNSSGSVDVTLINALPNGQTRAVTMACNAGLLTKFVTCAMTSSTKLSIRSYTSTSGAAADCDLSFLIYAT